MRRFSPPPQDRDLLPSGATKLTDDRAATGEIESDGGAGSGNVYNTHGLGLKSFGENNNIYNEHPFKFHNSARQQVAMGTGDQMEALEQQVTALTHEVAYLRKFIARCAAKQQSQKLAIAPSMQSSAAGTSNHADPSPYAGESNNNGLLPTVTAAAFNDVEALSVLQGALFSGADGTTRLCRVLMEAYPWLASGIQEQCTDVSNKKKYSGWKEGSSAKERGRKGKASLETKKKKKKTRHSSSSSSESCSDNEDDEDDSNESHSNSTTRQSADNDSDSSDTSADRSEKKKSKKSKSRSRKGSENNRKMTKHQHRDSNTTNANSASLPEKELRPSVHQSGSANNKGRTSSSLSKVTEEGEFGDRAHNGKQQLASKREISKSSILQESTQEEPTRPQQSSIISGTANIIRGGANTQQQQQQLQQHAGLVSDQNEEDDIDDEFPVVAGGGSSGNNHNGSRQHSTHGGGGGGGGGVSGALGGILSFRRAGNSALNSGGSSNTNTTTRKSAIMQRFQKDTIEDEFD